MERLSIEEIIEHCERHTERCERVEMDRVKMGGRPISFETDNMSCSFMKEYWEHRQVAEYLKEFKAYRAIEIELKEKYQANVDIKMLMQHFIETIFKGEKHGGFCILTNEDAKRWEQYKAIGTVEEFKTLKEKSEPKKDNNDGGRCKKLWNI